MQAQSDPLGYVFLSVHTRILLAPFLGGLVTSTSDRTQLAPVRENSKSVVRHGRRAFALLQWFGVCRRALLRHSDGLWRPRAYRPSPETW